MKRPRGARGEARQHPEGTRRARPEIAVDADTPIGRGQVGLTIDGDCVEPAVSIHVCCHDGVAGERGSRVIDFRLDAGIAIAQING